VESAPSVTRSASCLFTFVEAESEGCRRYLAAPKTERLITGLTTKKWTDLSLLPITA
jgi:hypothetical protein